MKSGNQNLKNNKTIVTIFLSLFFIYLIYCICIIPSYLFERSMGYITQPWARIDHYLYNSPIGSIYSWLYYKIPDFTLIPAFIVNAGNMVFGFVNYKKKWWYYLILAVSILCSVLLVDYYDIYTYDDVWMTIV